MTKEIIKIVDVQHAVSQSNKPYIKVNGSMTVFEKTLIDLFSNNIGKFYEVEIAESNGYTNIRKCYGEAAQAPVAQTAPQAPVQAAPTPNQKARPAVKTEMLVSYAKDLMCAYLDSPLKSEITKAYSTPEACMEIIKKAYKELSNL